MKYALTQKSQIRAGIEVLYVRGSRKVMLIILDTLNYEALVRSYATKSYTVRRYGRRIFSSMLRSIPVWPKLIAAQKCNDGRGSGEVKKDSCLPGKARNTDLLRVCRQDRMLEQQLQSIAKYCTVCWRQPQTGGRGRTAKRL